MMDKIEDPSIHLDKMIKLNKLLKKLTIHKMLHNTHEKAL